MGTRADSRRPSRRARWVLLGLIFTLVMPLFLVSCGEPEDDFLLSRARELLPQAQEMDDLLFISGVPQKTGSEAENGYYPADMDALAAFGFSTVADIKARVREIWTARYADGFEKSAVFSAVVGSAGIESLAYLVDTYDKDGNLTGVRVSAAGIPTQMDRVLYHTDTLQVTWKSKKTARLTVSATVTNGEGDTQDRERELTLALDSDGVWRFDASTYMKYRKDHYDATGYLTDMYPEKRRVYNGI